ncbi:MAG: HEPN domain-containing protein [Bacillota bacterium]
MEGSINDMRIWIYKSDRSLNAASALFRMGYYAECISRSYYAVFYCLKALFLQDKITVNKPSAMLALLGKRYVQEGKLEPCYHKSLFYLFDLRFQFEYECQNPDNIDLAKYAIETASSFIKEIKANLLKIA